MMPRFKQETAGENGWTDDIFPIMRGYKLACCDCGLVHDVEFDVYEVKRHHKDGIHFSAKKRRGKKWRVAMRVRRNNRSTALMRRKSKEKKRNEREFIESA
jgi:hypothetical protein